MTKLLLKLDDEIRSLWNAVLRARDEVATWPDWKHTEQPKEPVTANPDFAMYEPAIHRAETLDMRPGDTIVGRVPTRPPANDTVRVSKSAVCVLPPLDTATEDELADLAANVTSDTDSGRDDLWLLSGSSPHIVAICELLGRREMQLDSAIDKIEHLENNVRILSQQLATAHSIGAEYRGKAQRYEQALVMTTNDLYAEKNEVVRLKTMLATERHRLERESQMHHETVNRLIKQTAEACRLTRKLAEMEKKP